MYRLVILKFFVLTIALSLITCSKDEGEAEIKSIESWKQLTDFPGEGRSSGLAFTLSGKGYWGLGATTSGYLSDIWSYDPNSDSWEQKNDFPFELPVEVSVTINDKAYVVTYSGSVYEYDPALDEWKYRSNSPLGNRPGLTGFSLEGKAYFGTGNNVDVQNFTVYNDFWQYDPLLNEWKGIADFPGIARTQAVSFVIGSMAYVGLGYNGEGAPPIYKDIWSYDSKTDEWNRVADFPEANSLVGILFSNNTNAFIGLPANDNLHLGQMYEYTVTSNSWRKIKTFPSGNSLETGSFTINDRMFVVGGWWSDYSKQVWEFTQ